MSSIAVTRAMIRSVCFDLGGVIVGAFSEPMMELASELFGRPSGAIEAAMRVHKAALQTGRIDHVTHWKLVAQELEVPYPEGAARLFVDPWLEHATIDEEMLAFVEELKARFIVGCLSNTQEPHVTLLREMGVLDHFDPCVLSCEVGLRKPGHEIFELYCREAGVEASEVLFVDDQPENLDEPRRLGMRVVRFEGIGSVRAALPTGQA